MDQGFVTVNTDPQGLTTLTFGHPAHNALPARLLAQLADAIEQAGNDPSTRLILLQSAGEGTFCAGADFSELLAIDDEAAGKEFFSGFANVINAMRKAPRLILGRVLGKAVGGGVGLIAACDYVFATEKAAVRLSEVSINIGPFVIAPAVERKVGISAFTELTLNPSVFFDVQWAKRHDLFHTVKTDIAQLDEGIKEFCDRLITKNPEALSELKRTLWHGTKHWNELLYKQAAISGRLACSPETKALLQSIKTKNPS
jgi:methylglutaconyl-CoA hydratase